MSFSSQIRKVLAQKGLTQAVLANSLGITRGRLNNYIMGRSEPDYELLKKIARNLNVTTDYLLEMTPDATPVAESRIDSGCELSLRESNPDKNEDADSSHSSWVPVYRTRSAAVDRAADITPIVWLHLPDIDNYSLPTRRCYGLYVSDDSMAPGLLPGDLVLMRPMISYLFLNASDQQAIYSVRLSEADEVGLCLRHCILAGDMLSFVADNPRYGATAFDMQRTNFVPIVGRVVRMIRSYDDLNRYFVG